MQTVQRPERRCTDLKDRLTTRVQLTTDGLKRYLEPIETVFGEDVDYAMLQKIYGTDPHDEHKRYSPAKVMSMSLEVIKGNPDPKHISTSFVERQNLTMRMSRGDGLSLFGAV
jgi:hypothetical protein